MVDKLKQRAAQHSVKAFALLTAVRLLRRAAADFREADELVLASLVKSIAVKADRRRRFIQAKKP